MVVSQNLGTPRRLDLIQPDPFNAEAAAGGRWPGRSRPPTSTTFAATSRSPRTMASSRSAARSENPTTLTLDDLRAMPAVERVVTLECAGNGRLRQTPLPVGEPWGKCAVSTARWTGAFLYQVLEQARPATSGSRSSSKAPITAATTSTRTSPSYGRWRFAHAPTRRREILIAYEMNGEPLNPTTARPSGSSCRTGTASRPSSG